MGVITIDEAVIVINEGSGSGPNRKNDKVYVSPSMSVKVGKLYVPIAPWCKDIYGTGVTIVGALFAVTVTVK